MGSDPPARSGLDDTVPAAVPLMEGAPASAHPAPPSDRYRLGTELGRGGMGRVVEAFDIQLGRTVALKEALPRGGSGTYRRFAREIQITARLEHASIVPLYDSGTTSDGRPFYVMRRVSGRPFDEMIARARGLGERLTLLPAFKAACDAIGHAHRRSVIHRDLKPANILVGEAGETVVIDWGLAKVIGEDDDVETSRDSVPPDRDLQTQVGSVFGTPGFMAPEQARGEELGPRGDVYALGATLYQMLTGAPPYGGKSATEVIDRNRKAQIKPIAEAAPEAPRELIAIVHKSLAADAEHRYPDAAALAEDVRRFLDGQLVAAHRYTPTQRVRRFVRRHRAPLAVAALAAVAVAALSWFSVHRVLSERAVAVERQHEAEDRADALIVARARALIDTNATEAIATLKGLRKGSPHEAEARGVAQAAAARGIAWGIEDEGVAGTVLYPYLAPNGAMLAVASLDGRLRVYDATTHALLVERAYTRGMRPAWVDDSKHLIIFDLDLPAVLLDPVSGVATPLAMGTVSGAIANDRGDRILYISGDRKTAGLYELATGATTPLWTGPDRVTSTAIAPDGSWMLVGGSTDVVVYDGSGREIARKQVGRVMQATGSRNHRVAVIAENSIWQLDVDHVTWSEVPLELGPNTVALHVTYRGDTLAVITSRGEVREWRGGRWDVRVTIDQLGPGLTTVGSELLVIGGSDGRVYWISPTTSGVLRLPTVASAIWLAGSRDSTRLVVTGDDLILVYDLGALSPGRLPAPEHTPTFAFLDDDTIVFWTNTDPWMLLRTKTGQIVKFDVPWHGAALQVDDLPEEGRMLFEYMEEHVHLIEIRDSAHPLRHLAATAAQRRATAFPFVGRLLPGGGAVFATSNALEGAVDEAPSHEIARLDGDIISIGRVGYLEYAAVSAHGELIRGSLGTGSFERSRVPENAQLLVEGFGGKVVISSGAQLFLWDKGAKDVVEIAHFTQPVTGLREVVGGIAVVLTDGRVLDVSLDPDSHAYVSTELLPRGSTVLGIGNGGGLLIARGNAALLNVVELPSHVRWTLPIVDSAGGTLTLAPTSGQIAQEYDVGLATWTLPHIDGDFHAWLDAATNAIEDSDGDLAWPWRKP